MQCGRCGNSCPPEARFCPRCGERLIASEPVASDVSRTGADTTQLWPPSDSTRLTSAAVPADPYASSSVPQLPADPYAGRWPTPPPGYYREAPGAPEGYPPTSSPPRSGGYPPAMPYPPETHSYPSPAGPSLPQGPYPGYEPGPLDPAAYPLAGTPLLGRQRLIESIYPHDQLMTASAGRRLGAAVLDVTLMFVTLFIGWFIWFCVVARNGQTPGKQLLGMYVLRDDGTRAGGWYMWMREALIKNVFWFASFFTMGLVPLLAAAWCMWDNDTQCLWDKIGSTYVGYSPYGFKPLTRKEQQQRLLPR
jgi:uncharacterized RDD family membrane protein YckC